MIVYRFLHVVILDVASYVLGVWQVLGCHLEDVRASSVKGDGEREDECVT